MAAQQRDPVITCHRCEQLAKHDKRYMQCDVSQISKGELCNMCKHDNQKGCDHLCRPKPVRDARLQTRANIRAGAQAQGQVAPSTIKNRLKKAVQLKKDAESKLHSSEEQFHQDLENMRQEFQRHQTELETMINTGLSSAEMRANYERLRQSTEEHKQRYERLSATLPAMVKAAGNGVDLAKSGMKHQLPLPSLAPTHHYNHPPGNVSQPSNGQGHAQINQNNWMAQPPQYAYGSHGDFPPGYPPHHVAYGQASVNNTTMAGLSPYQDAYGQPSGNNFPMAGLPPYQDAYGQFSGSHNNHTTGAMLPPAPQPLPHPSQAPWGYNTLHQQQQNYNQQWHDQQARAAVPGVPLFGTAGTAWPHSFQGNAPAPLPSPFYGGVLPPPPPPGWQ